MNGAVEVFAPPREMARDARQLRGKRVIIVHGSLEVGGAEVQSLHLAKYFQDCGNHVEVWGLSAPGRLTARCDELGIAWRVIGVQWARGRWGRMRDLVRLGMALRRAAPDVLLPYTDIPNMLCGALSAVSGARLCVWSSRGADTLDRDSRLVRYAVRQTHCFIANSEHGRRHLIESFGVPAENVSAIHNGVTLPPPARNRSAWRRELELADDSPAACMVGNLTGFKDHRTLLKAWRLVLDRSGAPAPVLVLAGRMDYTTDTLKALAHDLDLGRSVRFLGHVDDVSGLLGAMDLCVFSSPAEGLPNGVLEAMAAGLPVVAGDNPGVREAVGEEGLSLLVPLRDPDALADRVVSMFRDASERVRVGRLNRRRVEESFTVQEMCERTSRLLAAQVS